MAGLSTRRYDRALHLAIALLSSREPKHAWRLLNLKA
jgi:hypothetical protein